MNGPASFARFRSSSSASYVTTDPEPAGATVITS